MPVIVMMILPVAFSGALFILPVTGRSLSIISMVALIMLAGTVVNNSIILVDYINVRRERGESRENAILQACPLRIRPVMMTTITTVLAMVPMAMATGDTPEMMTDMCLTMMSGMIISTVITLLFTPVYYSVIDELPHRLRERRQKRKEKKALAAANAENPAISENAEGPVAEDTSVPEATEEVPVSEEAAAESSPEANTEP